MNIGNWGRELAELRADQERDAGVAAVQRALEQDGFGFCHQCGVEIEAERRAALPSARRCIDCQEELERARCR